MIKRIINKIFKKNKVSDPYISIREEFRKKNEHNEMNLCTIYPVENIEVGKCTYGDLNIRSYNNIGKIIIGNYCSIADKVEFIIGGEHNYKRISTFPFQSKIYKQALKKVPNYNIVIEDDVWIGYDCIIMSKAHIGKGSVIGARSIVTGDIPPYSIYVGNKVIKKRFSDEVIKKLMKVDYSKINHVCDDEYSDYCQVEITEENVDEIIKKFKSN